MKRLLHRQEGAALVMSLAFLMLSVPLVIAAQKLASTLALDSRAKTDIVMTQHSNWGASEHVRFRLAYEDGYVENLPLNSPQSYVVRLNGKDITVTVVRTADPPLAPPLTVPSSESGREFRTAKSVTPGIATPGLTTFTYTITVWNTALTTQQVSTVYDKLPYGLSYVSGFTSGMTTNDPQINDEELKWENLAYNIGGGASSTLTFRARGTLSQGVYCNEAWVDPGGRSKTNSDKTAKIVVGSPSSSLCPDEAVTITKSVTPNVVIAGDSETFIYTITMENRGTEELELGVLKDLLPEGFVYAPGSSSGMTTADPSLSQSNDRWHLTYAYSPEAQLAPGQTRTQVFLATAAPAVGFHYSEVWAIIDDFPYEFYTWPTSPVQGLSIMVTCTTDGQSSVSSEVWVGSGTSTLGVWELTVGNQHKWDRLGPEKIIIMKSCVGAP